MLCRSPEHVTARHGTSRYVTAERMHLNRAGRGTGDLCTGALIATSRDPSLYM